MSNNLPFVFAEIDALNSMDPNMELVDGQPQPKELVYGQRMSEQLNLFCPQASERLQIAARAQHIQRWKIARSTYPEGRSGYKQWRMGLAKFHGDMTADIMAKFEYSDDDQQIVKDMLLKKNLKRDPDTQCLEDVICLVFLQYYLEPFAAKHAEEKLIVIIQKTWKKMSEKGHQAALSLSFSPTMFAVIKKALL